MLRGAGPHASGILLAVLRDPHALAALSIVDWDLLLRQARRARLTARLASMVQDLGLAQQLPDKIRDHLSAAEAVAAHNAHVLRWEANRIERVLAPLNIPVVLLKGAAYILAELPAARGRVAADTDIMVPEDSLHDVRSALESRGWESIDLDPYDQRYYRQWMHELPPLRHRERGTVLDVHHTILPRTSRLRPDVSKLWEGVRGLPNHSFYVLSPEDMLLHSAAHLFHDGDLKVAIRDLVDIHDLLGHFGRDDSFWQRLVPRARQMDLTRPLFYAMRYAAGLLGTPIPEPVMQEAQAGAPNRVVRDIMDRLVPSVLLPRDPDRPSLGAGRAAMALYVRSHWLRMPPWLLAAHLTRKALKRWARNRADLNR